MDHANEEVHELPEEVACVDVPTNVEGFLVGPLLVVIHKLV